MYRLTGNSTYADTLITLDNMEDHNYEENEKIIRPVGVHCRILEQKYMEKWKEIEKNNMPPLLLRRRKDNTSYNTKKKREVYTDGSKNPGRK